MAPSSTGEFTSSASDGGNRLVVHDSRWDPSNATLASIDPVITSPDIATPMSFTVTLLYSEPEMPGTYSVT